MESVELEPTTTNEPWALKDLPPFPWITTRVLQLFSVSGDQVDVPRLTELIRSDASLSSELLRRANSPLFGLRSEVASVERAVTMLGIRRVKNLAMTLGIGGYVRKSLRLAVLRRCWRHVLGCGLLAEELAEAAKVHPDQAYTAGLLHDIGRMALLVKYPQSYADLLSVVVENHLGLLESERDLFDIDHCEAGVWLAEKWHFPKSLVHVIADHHMASPHGGSGVSWLVHVCCRLADGFGFEVVPTEANESPERVLAELPKPFHLGGEDIEALRRRVTDRVNALE